MTDEPAPTLGLVLGGGAALGAAHAGVLQVLEEAGISCPVVAGTSAGALVGAGYAAELTAAMITEVVLGARWEDFAQFNWEWRWGLLDASPLEQNVEKHLPVTLLEELPRKLGVLAWDIRSSEAVLFTEGPLRTALRATSAVPGLFPPVHVGDRVLVDGAFADNVPVWAARALGADRVIAVDLGKETESLVETTGRLLERLRDPNSGAEGLRENTARLLAAIKQARNREPVSTPASEPDVLIRPRTEGISRWSSRGTADLIAAGRAAAEAALPALSALAPRH